MRPLGAAAAVLLCSASVIDDASAFGLSSGWRRSASGGMLRPRTAIAQSADSSNAAAAAPHHAEARSLALPPRFVEKINVPLDTPFKLEREGPPTAAELEDTNLIKIICEGSSDEETNWLVWKCLGYRYSAADDSWSADDVFANWKSKYPTPPDLIGVTRHIVKDHCSWQTKLMYLHDCCSSRAL
eukprot:17120-Heterococcus_DN1.PRE.2